MERTEAHDFFLLKEKKHLDVRKSNFFLELWSAEETSEYLQIAEFWMHDDFVRYIWPSLTGLSVKLDDTGPTIIRSKADAEKLIKICTGWVIIIQEMTEIIAISEWETKFQREELLQWVNDLKDMAEQMNQHEDYVICYCGI